MSQSQLAQSFHEEPKEDLDYQEFLPKGTTQFGSLTTTNEAAFIQQFPELVHEFEALKRRIEKVRALLETLPSYDEVDFGLVIEPIDSITENSRPNNTPFQMRVRIEEQKALLDRLLAMSHWKEKGQELLAMVENKKREAGIRHDRAVADIKSYLTDSKGEWTWASGNVKKGVAKKVFEAKVVESERETQRGNDANDLAQEITRVLSKMEHSLPTLEEMEVFKKVSNLTKNPLNAEQLSLMMWHDPIEGAKEKAKEAKRQEEIEKVRKAREDALTAAREREERRVILEAQEQGKFRKRMMAIIAAIGLAAVGVGVKMGMVLEKYEPLQETGSPELDEDFEVLPAHQEIADNALAALMYGLSQSSALLEYAEFLNPNPLYVAMVDNFNKKMLKKGVVMKDVDMTFIPVNGGSEPPYVYDIEGTAYVYSVSDFEGAPLYALPMVYENLELQKPLANPAEDLADILVQRSLRTAFYKTVSTGGDQEDLSGEIAEIFDKFAESKDSPLKFKEVKDLTIIPDEADPQKVTYALTAIIRGDNGKEYEIQQSAVLNKERKSPRRDSAFPELDSVEGERALMLKVILQESMEKMLKVMQLLHVQAPRKVNVKIYDNLVEEATYQVNNVLRSDPIKWKGLLCIGNSTIGENGEIEFLFREPSGALYVERAFVAADYN